MFGIGHLFGRIQGAFAKEVLARKAIVESIKKHTGIDVPIGDVSFKSGTAMLSNVNQAGRSAIFIKKEAILRDIASLQSVRAIRDIR